MTAFQRLSRRSLWVGLGVAVLLTACSTAPPRYKTVLTGEKEVPQVNKAASGLSDLVVRACQMPTPGCT
jgi:uncharacterized lipoprotein YmbA